MTVSRRGPCSRPGLRDSTLQIRAHDDTLLLVRIGARSHTQRGSDAAVHSHVRYARRDVEVIAIMRDGLLVQIFPCPQLDLVPAHDVESRLMVLVYVGFRSSARRKHD